LYRLKLLKGEETIIALTHWFQLTNELFFCPFLLLGPQVYGIGNQHFVVIGVRNIQIMNQHNIWILKWQWKMVTEKCTGILAKIYVKFLFTITIIYLKKPITSPVKCW